MTAFFRHSITVALLTGVAACTQAGVSFFVSGSQLTMILDTPVVFTGNASAQGGQQIGLFINNAFSSPPTASLITSSSSGTMTLSDSSASIGTVPENGYGSGYLAGETFLVLGFSVYDQATNYLTFQEGDHVTLSAGTYTLIGVHGETAVLPHFTTAYGYLVDTNLIQVSDAQAFTMTAVPEPTTYAILASGVALGYVALRRRRAA